MTRCPLTPLPVVDAIRALRKSNPEYSKYKLEVILKRDYDYRVSACIIRKYDLFFEPPVKSKRHPDTLVSASPTAAGSAH